MRKNDNFVEDTMIFMTFLVQKEQIFIGVYRRFLLKVLTTTVNFSLLAGSLLEDRPVERIYFSGRSLSKVVVDLFCQLLGRHDSFLFEMTKNRQMARK